MHSKSRQLQEYPCAMLVLRCYDTKNGGGVTKALWVLLELPVSSDQAALQAPKAALEAQ